MYTDCIFHALGLFLDIAYNTKKKVAFLTQEENINNTKK